jgi:hypothetical protein
MIPVPPLRLPLTSSTVPARLPVCSYSSCLSHSLIVTFFLCKNIPFACTIPPLIGGEDDVGWFFRPDLLL